MRNTWMITPGWTKQYGLYGLSLESDSINQLIDDSGMELIARSDAVIIHHLKNVERGQLIYLWMQTEIWAALQHRQVFPLNNYNYRVWSNDDDTHVLTYCIEITEDINEALPKLVEWVEKSE